MPAEWMTAGLGAVLVVVVMIDLSMTAVSVSHGAGPLAGSVARTVWRGILRVHSRFGTPRLLISGGPVILLLVIVTWIVLLLVGWSLVFGQPDTLLTVQDGTPAAALGRLRYAASLVIGRGSGGLRPAGELYVTLEPVAALTGLAVVSLSIAYVLPVVQGVVEKRSLALYISSLGETPADMLIDAWDGESLGQHDLHLIALAPRVASVAQSHLAYPVIHYFHSGDRATALGPCIAALDTALTVNQHLEESVRIDRNAVVPLRRAVDRFLRTLELAFIRPGDVPADPDDEPLRETVDRLRERGVPVTTDGLALSEPEAERSRLLRGYLVHDGWEHLDVVAARRAA